MTGSSWTTPATLEDRLMPDLSENIDLCVWVPLDELLDRMQTARTYLRGEVTRAIDEAIGAAALV